MTGWDTPIDNDDDSGVGTTPGHYMKVWNDIQAEELNKEGQHSSTTFTHIYAEICGRSLAIARNKENCASDRIAALEVVRKITWDMAHNPCIAGEQAENGNRGMA